MRILGIDPGTTRVGYGIVEKGNSNYRALQYGLINCESISDKRERLSTIYRGILLLVETHQPDAAAMELLFFYKNSKTIIPVAEARGVILLALYEKKIPILELTPLQVKQGVTGYGKADKNQVGNMVRMLLNLSEIPQPDDIADALSIAITGANYFKKDKNLKGA